MASQECANLADKRTQTLNEIERVKQRLGISERETVSMRDEIEVLKNEN